MYTLIYFIIFVLLCVVWRISEMFHDAKKTKNICGGLYIENDNGKVLIYAAFNSENDLSKLKNGDIIQMRIHKNFQTK